MSQTKNNKPVTGIKTADKSVITLLALKRPERPAAIVEKPVKDEVISLPATEEPVSDDAASPLPLSSKPSIEVANHTESEQKPKKVITIDIPKSNDPLIGTQIEVTAPWGGKTLATIVGSSISSSGDRWVSFLPIEECPTGWNWEGGVKLLKSI